MSRYEFKSILEDETGIKTEILLKGNAEKLDDLLNDFHFFLSAMGYSDQLIEEYLPFLGKLS